jgi:signal transduction histidine kinase
MIKKDLTVPGLVHDLNNVFQTLVDAATHLSEDPQKAPLAEAILRSVERGQRISLSLQSVESPGASFASVLNDAISFVQDARLVRRGPKILFEQKIDGEIKLRRNWAWERVLINLFLNSARAMPEGGTIEIEARCEGPHFLIFVRDSGTGIPVEMLDQLFHPNTSTKPTGGLGLHVVETIVHQNGGTVQARNRTDGPGAEFSIAVPLAIAGMPQIVAACASGD